MEGNNLIPNEILKNRNITQLLLKLFQRCFISYMVPQQWLQAIDCPIPRVRNNDKIIPLNFRGISLVSIV